MNNPRLEDEAGDIIAKARTGLGMTTRQLSALTGIAEREIQEIESCRLAPGEEAIRKIAPALSLDPDRLSAIASGNWAPRPVRVPDHGPLVHEIKSVSGAFGANCYLLACRKSSEAAVIDPGGNAAQIEELLQSRRLRLSRVLLTHTHSDHTAGLPALLELHPHVNVLSHPNERSPLLGRAEWNWQPAEDGKGVPIGTLVVTAIHVPGHTPGSVCYLTNGVCFVGDVLFAGSAGRPGGGFEFTRTLDLIRTRILSLPDSTILFPGHGPATTVGEEKAHNPFFP